MEPSKTLMLFHEWKISVAPATITLEGELVTIIAFQTKYLFNKVYDITLYPVFKREWFSFNDPVQLRSYSSNYTLITNKCGKF